MKKNSISLPIRIDLEKVKNIANNFQEIGSFYFQQLQFLHPMTKERINFIEKTVSLILSKGIK